MQFNSLGSSNAASYAGAGKSVADSAAKVFDVQRKTGPNYQKISQTAMVTQAEEKITAMKTAAQVTKQGIENLRDKTLTQHKLAVFNDKLKRDQKTRKAGVIAGLGKLAGAGFLAASDPTKGREYPKADFNSFFEKWKAQRDGIKARQQQERDALGEFKPDPIKFDSPSTGGDSGKVTGGSNSSPGQGASGVTPAGTGMAYMKDLTAQGFTPVQAAAITGHMDVESDGFRAYEEYAPNRHGTRGIGHLQWTDPSPGKGRRTSFLSHAKSQGLDPKKYEANFSYLLAEMAGNYGNHWTNGGSLEGFKQIKDFNQASAYLQNNYIRPGIPHTDRRIAAGQRYLQQYNQSLTS